MSMTTNQELSESGLLRLITWLSPSFPVGAYTYSHGIEYAVEEGLVRDSRTLADWTETILLNGAGQTDAVLFAQAHRAVICSDDRLLERIFELADVMRGSSEMALESSAQGAAFLKMLSAVWPHPVLEEWGRKVADMGGSPAYPVVVALAAALHRIPLDSALSAFLHATAANLISAGVRLVPLGQTDGQKATAALEEVIIEARRIAMETELEDIGSSAPMVDWTSFSHETQYTRLFRS